MFLLATTYASAQQTTAWGDQGNGTYVNPILNADYSDPDVIRVGEKYYMVCSDFHYIGMPVLESTDMVNWTIISQVYNRFDYPKWDTNERFAGGSWAPAIRYHDGKFWVFEYGYRSAWPVVSAALRKKGKEMGRPLSFLGRRRASLSRAQQAWSGSHYHT